jgi:phosphopantothenoylcysteine decarboxylase/phosphopantothenate--cysteine ligase
LFNGKKIILGVTGSIAAYKSAILVRKLKELEASVWVVMTRAATKFITPLTLQTLSQNKVYQDLFLNPHAYVPEHISLNQDKDLILIAPATLNTISKISKGIADNLLTTIVLSTKAEVAFAPAMNENMYLNPIFQKNISLLKDLGYHFIEPDYGRLVCQEVGRGRMADIDRIIEEVKKIFYKNLPLKDRKILITASSTREPLDLIRYFSNRSSGKMGYALAEEALNLGASVTLVSGPSQLVPPKEVRLIKVNTALEMKKVLLKEFKEHHIIICAAAVCDFRPKKVYNRKLRKGKEGLTIELIKNPDILKELGRRKKDKILVGFAAEDSEDIGKAVKKLKEKNLDLIVYNNIRREDSGFEVSTNRVKIINKEEEIKELPLLSKKEVSKEILKEIINLGR